MPYKDPKDQERWSKRWRKASKTNGYNKWLHARRRVRFDDAEKFRQALDVISLGVTADVAQDTAVEALLESRERWQELGEPPHRRRSDVKMDGLDIAVRQRRGVSLTDALAQLNIEK